MTKFRLNFILRKPVLGICDFLVRIRTLESVHLTIGSGSGSNFGSDSFLQWSFKDAKKFLCLFLRTYPQEHNHQS